MTSSYQDINNTYTSWYLIWHLDKIQLQSCDKDLDALILAINQRWHTYQWWHQQVPGCDHRNRKERRREQKTLHRNTGSYGTMDIFYYHGMNDDPTGQEVDGITLGRACIYVVQEKFSISIFVLFHFMYWCINLLAGALYDNKRYRPRYTSPDNNPHLIP